MRSPDAQKLVGARLARVLHAHICLLLDTQARQTATRSLLSQSQLCLQASICPMTCHVHIHWLCQACSLGLAIKITKAEAFLQCVHLSS